jgi:PPP family 3-phenylpropionic acid transporter
LHGSVTELTAFFRFVLLYGALYAAFGVASPFMPEFLSSRGLDPERLGVVLAAGTALRLLAGSVAGPLGDFFHALRAVLILCLFLSAAATLGYLPAYGFVPLLALNLLQVIALGPVTILADALSLNASTHPRPPSRGFEYGIVRGTGSAAFVIGTVLSGQAIATFGLSAIIWGEAALLAVAAVLARLAPEPTEPAGHSPGAERSAATREGVLTLLRLPAFLRLIAVAALVLGSHAMHDAFAVIRWSAAGIGAATASLLWSESVAAEVLVFFVLGPMLVARLTPAGAMMMAAAAGTLRWAVAATSADVVVVALIQPLHGITFALLHLACMRLIASLAPPALAGSAQAIYGTGAALASMALTLVSGVLYERIGAQGFWVMSAVSALALPIAYGLRRTAATTSAVNLAA